MNNVSDWRFTQIAIQSSCVELKITIIDVRQNLKKQRFFGQRVRRDVFDSLYISFQRTYRLIKCTQSRPCMVAIAMWSTTTPSYNSQLTLLPFVVRLFNFHKIKIKHITKFYQVCIQLFTLCYHSRPWPLRWVLGQGSLLPLSQGEAFTLASISYLAILVKYILEKNSNPPAWLLLSCGRLCNGCLKPSQKCLFHLTGNTTEINNLQVQTSNLKWIIDKHKLIVHK